MTEFGDALVIRILGDSSELQRELNAVLDDFSDLSQRVDRLASSSTQLTRLTTAITSLSAPLQSVGRLFDQVQRQANTLSQTAISLNVGPALNALAQLASAIARVQAQLQMLSLPWGGGMPMQLPGGGSGGGSLGAVRRFAEGGLVSGPGGIDRVPAWLTAGEFVLSREAVRQVGLPLLQDVNAGAGTTSSSRSSHRMEPVETTSITTQFGGVTIQLQQPSELPAVLDSLVMQEIHVRNRRG